MVHCTQMRGCTAAAPAVASCKKHFSKDTCNSALCCVSKCANPIGFRANGVLFYQPCSATYSCWYHVVGLKTSGAGVTAHVVVLQLRCVMSNDRTVVRLRIRVEDFFCMANGGRPMQHWDRPQHVAMSMDCHPRAVQSTHLHGIMM